MSIQLRKIDKNAVSSFLTEQDIEVHASAFLKTLGYGLKYRKTGTPDIDKHWPSKTKKASSKGAPDILIYTTDTTSPESRLFCVWENKILNGCANDALSEAKFYIEKLHRARPLTPGLPRLAAGYNGRELRLAYFNHDNIWLPLKINGLEITDEFPLPQHIINGISSTGNFLAAAGLATSHDLRKLLPALKIVYRSIPILASGRRPIDFTVGLLTLKMLVEMLPDWGTWAEQPGLAAGTPSKDHAIYERFVALVGKVFKNTKLRDRYGDIFNFAEKSGTSKEEIAFSFEECLKEIDINGNYFSSMFDILDSIPPLHGADFDVFGEVYQTIGDDATKKALGEFFTGRHIISSIIPVLFERAGIKSFDHSIEGKTIADIACGTGGFLTETLRYIKRKYRLDEEKIKDFAIKAFLRIRLEPIECF